MGPAQADETPTPDPSLLDTYWDGPTLNWDAFANSYATYSGTFVGYPISVPGDAAWRTLRLHNQGSCVGTVTVTVFNVMANYPPGTVNSELPEIIYIGLDAGGQQVKTTFASVIAQGGERQLAEFAIRENQDMPLTIGYEFPYEETRGRNHGWPSTALTFDVRVDLVTDITCRATPSVPPLATSASPSGSASRSASSTPRQTFSPLNTSAAPQPNPSSPGGRHPDTGAQIRNVAIWAAALILLGLIAWRRRRRSLN
jgi:MYXO-CTERM domain-containing protein